jgi:hypothetical protein
MLLPPPPGGRPPKTERPHRIPREHPINHHVTDPPHGEAADRDTGMKMAVGALSQAVRRRT